MPMAQSQEFRQQQLSKVERRRKENEKIKKGIYQMHVMVEGQCMDTLTKECGKTGTAGTKPEEGGEKNGSKENKKTDARTEMERMMAVGSRSVGFNTAKTLI